MLTRRALTWSTLTWSTLTLALLPGLALAQNSSSSMNASMGGSSAGPAGGSGGSAPPQVALDLDLPIAAPVYQGAPQPPAPTPEAPVDDPRDVPAPTLYGEEIVSESDTIFYVLDCSGSMSSDRQSYSGLDGGVQTGSRMERAKAELTRSILGLAPNFKLNIVAYDCSTQQWSDSMVPATDANKQAAIAWLSAQMPRGATGTGPATALALGQKENMSVVLLTDGQPNCGASGTEGHRQMISSNNTQGATINVFGIAASGTYRAFCQAVAADSGGSYYDVP